MAVVTAIAFRQAEGTMLESATTNNMAAAAATPAATAAAAPRPELRVFRPDNPYIALGLAVNHLMTKPAFANCKFGDWSRILVGQINRKHFWFVVDANNQIQGFMGWALTTKDKAEAWVEGRAGLSFDDAKDGDCVVFNAWAANSLKINRFLLAEGRKVIQGKDMVYFKRHYNDGSTRPARLSVNDFVDQHIERKKKPAG
jgi:hemolysin-activating ACP:hemolysin acyltransferase